MSISKTIRQAYSSRNWFQLPRPFLGMMSVNEAVLLAHLINVADRVDAEDGDWFRFTTEETKRETYMSEDVQKRALSKLKGQKKQVGGEEESLVEVKMIGNPAKRHVQINFILLDQMVTEFLDKQEPRAGDFARAKGGRMNPGSGGRANEPGLRIEESRKRVLSELKGSDEKTTGKVSRNGKPTGKKKVPSKFDNRCAKELAKIVLTKTKVNKRAGMAQWAQQFRLMREQDRIPKKDIKASILWYMDHIQDEYSPEAYSGGAYRNKYEKIVAAMNRKSNGNGNGTGETQEDKLITNLRSICWTRFGYGKPTQVNLDKVLVEQGRKPGSMKSHELG